MKYIVVNTPSAYNLFFERPSLNRLGAVASITHMKMKLPLPEKKVIMMRVDQKMARKCYESSLKNHRGTYTITTQSGEPRWVVEVDPCNEGGLNLL